MQLNKSHAKDYENISPLLVNAITIPVDGTKVVIYVAGSPFNPEDTATRSEIDDVVKALRLKP